MSAEPRADTLLERLQDAQLLAAVAATPSEACPPAPTLWALAQGELSPDEAATRTDHVATCHVCAEALRLAVELGLPPSAESPARPRAGRGWLIGGVTLLAAGLAALVVGRPTSSIPVASDRDPEIVRGPEGRAFRSTCPAALPRDGFVLTWSAGPPGTVFDLRVLDSELKLLHEVFELTEPRGVVPASSLVDHPEGAPVLWTVTAYLPDGRRVALPTWTTRLASAERKAGD